MTDRDSKPGAGSQQQLPLGNEPDLQSVWRQAVAGVADGMLSAQQRAWLRLTRPLGLVQDTALLAAPNEFTKDLLDSRLRPFLTTALTAAYGRDIRVAVTVEHLPDPEPMTGPMVLPQPPVATTSPRSRADGLGGENGALDAPTPPIQRMAPGLGRDPEPRPSEPARLNPRYIFETFVIGDSNRFPHAAAVAVAEAPAKAYNPLFIYGDSGLGKTHLLHAIGHYTLKLYPDSQVKYVSTEEFTNDFINSIRDDRQQAFQRRYRDIDVLLVDDIQFLENKERTQEEFFHTFNVLHDTEKQLVISSDRSPRQLSALEDRLRSRFEWGLITDVTPPDLETRIAILSKKAAIERLPVPPDVLEYIATHIERNIRELEGALIRVAAFASLNKSHVDRTLAEIVLRDLIPDATSSEISATSIMNATAAYFGVSMEDLCGTSRSRVLVTARQIAMYLCRELTDLSLPKIGQHFGGRDHTTVMHADRKIRGLMAERRAIYNQVTELTNRIRSETRHL
ncbi:chromosomal replication initiator protein DnaA [Frankia sp. CNm7]|uniref:Chromosomal replication initiator protein DnaA n=1 Tax=Frankia nepalensis TaxID=1836974 RepID=A0A937RIU6_9ACTN|nr:chromosomal replication initiator protein DnaA [Frankia nepalensis]MBL7496739.1 chromosomal replication initiator protein DnaA [Frankia nepalensis]MBL7510439.1 chromosomal replication initiator protein DnaA [Frankia nepalensis]MBL7523496.1 chromosomal replication initiator protein DnaA [Frankia nepalensis]MBL7630967.1 chromosomal replication initiator protein DnaA [Frankia nepalensis]